MKNKKSPILITLSHIHEDRYTYQANLLSSASVYSAACNQKGMRLLPKPVPTKHKFAYTSVPSPACRSPEPVHTPPNRDLLLSRDQGSGEEEFKSGSTKKYEGADLGNTAENKFIVPNIRSILQSEDYKELKISNGAIAKSVQITPKAGKYESYKRGVPRNINTSFRVQQKSTKTHTKTVLNESQVDKAMWEQEQLRRTLVETTKRKEAAEKEYITLSSKEDELVIAREKDATFILSQEEAFAKAIKEKKVVMNQCQSLTEKLQKTRRDLQWAEMVNKRYEEILSELSKNARTSDLVKAALKSEVL